jgi:CRP-like cAMP-binding protein
MNKPLSTGAIASLNRVLLLAATRAERILTDQAAEDLARDVARQCDEYANAIKRRDKAARAVELRRQGLTLPVIAERIGSSQSNVCKLLKEAKGREEIAT